ncbi:MAG: hypothetical protein JWN18_157 [Parcubacteria group bacterium]|nr:hypothetical protein [Parcubacteria group bacterium]
MRAKQWRQGLIIGILLLVAFWLVTLIWSLGAKAHIAISEAQQAKAHYEAIEVRKAALEANIAAIASDRGKDAAIRTAFGVARPGEEVIVVVPPQAATTTPKKSWWQKLFGWF